MAGKMGASTTTPSNPWESGFASKHKGPRK